LKKSFQNILHFISALLVTIVLLHFYGNTLETNVRNFYRSEICDCDTLRYKEFNDSSGVPYINYFSISGKHIGIKRNPTFVSFAADKYFQDITTDGNETNFQNCVHWILENAVTEDSCLFIPYKYAWVYDLKPGWKSAMGQGLAIKTLTQEYQLTHDSVYLAKIELFLNLFYKTVDEGGITYKTNQNEWWFEEYAQEKGLKPHILNGMMYALHGLYYNYVNTKNERSLMLFSKGISSLKASLPEYDNANNLSFYDSKKNVASEYYHNIHLRFLLEFYNITHEKIFSDYYQKWSKVKPESYFQKSVQNLNKTFVVLFTGVLIIVYLMILLLKVFLKKFFCKAT